MQCRSNRFNLSASNEFHKYDDRIVFQHPRELCSLYCFDAIIIVYRTLILRLIYLFNLYITVSRCLKLRVSKKWVLYSPVTSKWILCILTTRLYLLLSVICCFSPVSVYEHNNNTCYLFIYLFLFLSRPVRRVVNIDIDSLN